jgi:hypothetical protein
MCHNLFELWRLSRSILTLFIGTPMGDQPPKATHLHRTALGAHLTWRAVPGAQVSTTLVVDVSFASGCLEELVPSVQDPEP